MEMWEGCGTFLVENEKGSKEKRRDGKKKIRKKKKISPFVFGC